MVQENSEITKVPKPGESTIEQFNIEPIPQVNIGYDDLEQSGGNPENWLHYGNNYRRHHHTAADAIGPDNVSNLSREWVLDDLEYPNDTYGMQGSSLVIHGDPPILYQTSGDQYVRAVNARDGELLWQYHYTPRSGVADQDPSASRGLAVLGDTIYYSTLDFGMVALNRYTADEQWYYNGAFKYREDTVADIQWEAWEEGNNPNTAMHPELAYEKDRGSSSAYPPLVHDGVIIKGSFGGEMGVSGWLEGIPTEKGAGDIRERTGTETADGAETETPEAQQETPAEETPTEADGGAADTPTPQREHHVEPDAYAQQETPTETEAEGQTPTETEPPEEELTPEEPQQPLSPTPTETATPEGVGGEHNENLWLTRMTPPDEWVGESWKHGGGTCWGAPALDLETGTVVQGTANPGPWYGTARPGWNRYTAGKVALDLRTGDVNWSFQDSPHDWWDYDSPSPPLIYDAEVGGEQRTLVSWPGKTGWVYTTDLENGELIERTPFVEHHNMWSLPQRSFQQSDWIMPHLIGGTNPQPSTYDPQRRTMVLKGSNQPMKLAWSPIEYEVAQDYTGMDSITAAQPQREQIDGWNQPVGNVTALDPVTGEIKWQNWYQKLAWGGLMTTPTGLTFGGVANGIFYAWDTESGETLWQDEIGIGVDGNPISWIDPQAGKQYVYIQAGGSRGGGGQTMVCYSVPME